MFVFFIYTNLFDLHIQLIFNCFFFNLAIHSIFKLLHELICVIHDAVFFVDNLDFNYSIVIRDYQFTCKKINYEK